VFLNPAFINKYNIDPLTKLVLEPYEKTLRTTGLPKRAKKKYLVKRETFMATTGIDPEFIGLPVKKGSVEILLDNKDISKLQNSMAKITETLLRTIPRAGLRAIPPEEQVNYLAKEINEVTRMVREQFFREKFGKQVIEELKKREKRGE